MKEKVWIMNHYATNMYFDEGGRHYWFAENLIKKGYDPTIFCANTKHSSKDIIDTEGKDFIVKDTKNIPFVFVKTSEYTGNGLSRIKNMIQFSLNLVSTATEYAQTHGKPDVILASSVHPLTLVAGIKIANKFDVPCICEVRDLWPESIVAYSSLKRDSVIAKILYQGEKWIYKKADKLIFTMEGGKDYIVDKEWDLDNGGPINLSKVYHINNGVELESFNKNYIEKHFADKDLDCNDKFRVIYTGSIRKVNNVDKIVEIAKEIYIMGHKNIKVLIYGDGDDMQRLEERKQKEGIDNLFFKGKVAKEKIPYILSKSDLNIFHFKQNNIKKYGASLNKLFEYFASGKPVLSDCEFGYDLIKRYDCGVVIDNGSIEEVANEIVKISKLPKDKYSEMCENSLEAASDYDFKLLTNKLIDIINDGWEVK